MASSWRGCEEKKYERRTPTHKDGYGPGAIPGASYYAGGGHGGIGSYKGTPRTALATNEYGLASAPITDGSGGVLSATGGAGGYYGFGQQIGNHKNYTMQGTGEMPVPLSDPQFRAWLYGLSHFVV